MSQSVPPPKPVRSSDLLKELGTVRSFAKFPARAIRRKHRHLPRAEHPTGVMTLPGFGFGDAAMLPLRQRLRRQGFKPFKWTLGVNRGNVPQLIPLACERVLALAKQTDAPLALVGWSLGGYIAREVARECPEAVSRIVTLASPIRGGPKYTAVAGIYRRRGIDLDDIEQAIRDRETEPLRVPVSCIFSRNDGVVDWRAVVDFDNPLARHLEVTCSHMAMGFDPEVLDRVVEELCATSAA